MRFALARWGRRVAAPCLAALFCLPAVAGEATDAVPPYSVPDPLPEPRLFAEGVVSTSADEFGATFSRDGKTVLFSRSVPRSNLYLICEATFRDGRWTEPRVASFSGRFWDFDPVFTPDGSKVVFASDRPIPGKKKPDKDFDLWVVERTTSGAWGEPRPFGPNVNSDEDETFGSMASDGTLYFVSAREGGRAHLALFRSRLVNGEYGPPEKLRGPVNDPLNWSLEVLVAPDQSYLLLVPYGRPDGAGSFDIYVSRRDGESWTAPVSLGPKVNTRARDYSPRFSPDGRFLFWSSERGFATGPATHSFTDAELRRGLSSTLNGWGNIYQIDLHALGLELAP
jgi:Tol biopolymer transport system component